LDSGEDIPTGYQKIPYHMVFDVEYYLRHKARLVAGGNWTVNDKEDIYSGVVRMDTVRIGFFLGELYGILCFACDIGSITVCCIWIIVLGRIDIAYDTSAMSRFNMLPREGHLKAFIRILSYLKTFPKGRDIIDTSYLDHSICPVEDHSNWMEFYPDASEDIPRDLPPEKGQRVRMTVHVDADHAHDLVTRRSTTGIIVMLNYNPIRWIYKHQKTVETSTYGS
jgi:hypothetical protein